MEGSRACARLVRTMGAVAGIIIAIFIGRLLYGSIKVPAVVLVCAVKLALVTFTTALVVATEMPAGEVIRAALLVVIWAPTIILRWIVVPLRMPRLAYWMVRICWPLGLVKEIRAGAVVFGALALVQKGASDEALAWLTQRLRSAEPLHARVWSRRDSWRRCARTTTWRAVCSPWRTGWTSD